MKRILIIGPGGAGKSVLAQKLGEVLKIPIIHLDAHYWRPNWTKPTKEQWLNTVERLIKRKSWIMDGNFRSTMDIRMTAADTIIFLDFPKWLCLWRILKRRVQYHGKPRRDLGGGNTERLTWQFVRWVSNYPRAEVLDKITRLKGKKIVILKNPRDVNAF